MQSGTLGTGARITDPGGRVDGEANNPPVVVVSMD